MMVYYIISHNSNTIFAILLGVVVVSFTIVFYFRMFIKFYEFLFGGGYVSLVNTLKNHILPMVLFEKVDEHKKSSAIRRQSEIKRYKPKGVKRNGNNIKSIQS